MTDRAERDGRRLVRRLSRANPAATLVVSGCLAESAAGSLARDAGSRPRRPPRRARRACRILDAHAAGLLPGKVVAAADAARAALFAMPAEGRPPRGPPRRRPHARLPEDPGRLPAGCAFCIVPSLRGAERSARSRTSRRVRRLGDSGVPEVVLAGVHLAAFGHDRGTRLVDLLARLERDPPACRVRLSSLEPMEAGEDLVDLVASSRVVVPHLHLPLQSGSSSVLKRMRRGIVPARYRALAERGGAGEPAPPSRDRPHRRISRRDRGRVRGDAPLRRGAAVRVAPRLPVLAARGNRRRGWQRANPRAAGRPDRAHPRAAAPRRREGPARSPPGGGHAGRDRHAARRPRPHRPLPGRRLALPAEDRSGTPPRGPPRRRRGGSAPRGASLLDCAPPKTPEVSHVRSQ